MKEQPCIHNDGLHQWYLTGKTRMAWKEVKALAGMPLKLDEPDPSRKEREQVCCNCGDTRWR